MGYEQTELINNSAAADYGQTEMVNNQQTYGYDATELMFARGNNYDVTESVNSRNTWAADVYCGDSALGNPNKELGESFSRSFNGFELIVTDFVDYSSGMQSYIVPGEGIDGKQYILKIYKPGMYEKEKLERVLNAIQAKNHPNVARIISHGVFPGSVFNEEVIADDLRESKGRREYYYAIQPRYNKLKKDSLDYNTFSNSDDYLRRVYYFVDSCNKGLTSIHNGAEKIVHYDFKPDNIMFDKENDKIVIIDFGGAGIKEKKKDSTKTGKVTAIAATEKYKAPEIKDFGNKGYYYSDYYSLGVTLKDLLIVDSKKGIKLPSYYLTLIAGLIYYVSMPDLDEMDADIRANRWTSDMVNTWLGYIAKNEFDKIEAMKRNPGVTNNSDESLDDGEHRFKNGGYLEFDGNRVRSIREFADLYSAPNKWKQGIEHLQDEDMWDKEVIGSNLYANYIRNYVRDLSDPKGRSVYSIFFEFINKHRSNKEEFVWPGNPSYPDKNGVQNKVTNLYDLATYIRGHIGGASAYTLNNWRTCKDADARNICEWITNGVLTNYIKGVSSIDGEKPLSDSLRNELLSILNDAMKHANKDSNKKLFNQNSMTLYHLFSRKVHNNRGYIYGNSSGMIRFREYDDFLRYISETASDASRSDELIRFMKKHASSANFHSWVLMVTGKRSIEPGLLDFSKL